jgi:very-short-patch-repair endonuclease
VKRARWLRRETTLAEKKLWAALHSAGLVIEVDGSRHDLPEAQLRDAIRDEWLRSQGYHVLRFRNEQAFSDPDSIAQAILQILPSRSCSGESS